MRRRIPARVALGILALAAADCSTPPPGAYVARSDAADVVELAPGPGGEACRMLPAGRGAEVYCGPWDSPGARVHAVIPALPLPAAVERARSGLAARLDCDAPRPTTILGGQPAALMQCRRRHGGWPSFALVAEAGGGIWQVDGVLPAMAAAERAVGVLSGLATAAGPAPPSAALDLLAAQLARAAFSTGDIAQFEQLMTLGRNANQAERFVAAETAYRAALALQERLLGAGSPDTFAPMVRLAVQLSNQGRFAEADALFGSAARLAPRSADPLARALLAHYRGLHLANQGQADRALAAFAEAEALYAPELPPELRGRTPAPLPVLSATAADPLAARAVVGVVETRRNRAALLRALGRPAEATAAAARAEALAAAAPGLAGADQVAARLSRTGGAAAEEGGLIAAAEGSYRQSAEHFALGVPRSRPYAETLLLRAGARLESGARPESVLPLCRDAAAILRDLREGGSPQVVGPCVTAFVEASRRAAAPQALLGEGFATAQLAQGAVTTTQIARAAARLAEGARNPAVADAIRTRDQAGRAVADLLRERDALTAAAAREGRRADSAAIDARIAEAQAMAAEADQAAQAAAPGFAQLLQSAVTAEAALGALAPGEALVSMSLPPQGPGWVFLLHDGSITAGRIDAPAAEIEALVARLRASVEAGDGAKPFDAEAAWLLHRALFAEVAGPLAAARRLVVAPAGPLLSLPFGVLAEAEPRAARGHQGVQFLLARLPVTHVPAPASLVALRRAGPSQAARPWFGFGAPVPIPLARAERTFPQAPGCGRLLAALGPLPTATLELNASAQFMGAGPAEIRSGPAFTAAAVRRTPLRDYRVLHFATHGLLPRELSCLPEPAIIASPPAGAPDAAGALLTAATVLDLDLDADAVVLSACNSGGGAAAGESLSSLARAFFYAGTRGLVVTHWYVDDAAATRTVAIMLRNYRRGMDLAEALRRSQLDLVGSAGPAGHPAFWAPFALMGPGPAGSGAAVAAAAGG